METSTVGTLYMYAFIYLQVQTFLVQTITTVIKQKKLKLPVNKIDWKKIRPLLITKTTAGNPATTLVGNPPNLKPTLELPPLFHIFPTGQVTYSESKVDRIFFRYFLAKEFWVKNFKMFDVSPTKPSRELNTSLMPDYQMGSLQSLC